jgi:CRP-like cAMP-binding protein
MVAEMQLGEAELAIRYKAASKIQRMMRSHKGRDFTKIVKEAVHNEHIRQLSRLNEQRITPREVVLEVWTKYLHALDFFHTHPMNTCLDMLAAATFVHLPKNELLFKKGDVAADAYIIWEGEIGIFVGKKATKPLEVTVEEAPSEDADGDSASTPPADEAVPLLPPAVINNAMFKTRGRRLVPPFSKPAPIPEALIIAHDEAPVCHLKKGKMFGEFAMLSNNEGNKRSGAAVATEETYLIAIPKAAFEPLAMQQEQNLFEMKLDAIRISMFSYLVTCEASELRLARCLYPEKYRTGDVVLAQNNNARSASKQRFTLFARGSATRLNVDGTKGTVEPGIIISPKARLVVTALTPMLVFTLCVSEVQLLKLNPAESEMLELMKENPRAFENEVVEQHIDQELAMIQTREQRDAVREKVWRRKRHNHNKMVLLRMKGLHLLPPAANAVVGMVKEGALRGNKGKTAAKKELSVATITKFPATAAPALPTPRIRSHGVAFTGVNTLATEAYHAHGHEDHPAEECKAVSNSLAVLKAHQRTPAVTPAHQQTPAVIEESEPSESDSGSDEDQEEDEAVNERAKESYEMYNEMNKDPDSHLPDEKTDSKQMEVDAPSQEETHGKGVRRAVGTYSRFGAEVKHVKLKTKLKASAASARASNSADRQFLLVQQQLEKLRMEDEDAEEAEKRESRASVLPQVSVKPQFQYERAMSPLASLTIGLQYPQAYPGQRPRPNSAQRSRPSSATPLLRSPAIARPASAKRHARDQLPYAMSRSPVAGRSFSPQTPTYGLLSLRSLPSMTTPLSVNMLNLSSDGDYRTSPINSSKSRSRPSSASRSRPGSAGRLRPSSAARVR